MRRISASRGIGKGYAETVTRLLGWIRDLDMNLIATGLEEERVSIASATNPFPPYPRRPVKTYLAEIWRGRVRMVLEKTCMTLSISAVMVVDEGARPPATVVSLMEEGAGKLLVLRNDASSLLDSATHSSHSLSSWSSSSMSLKAWNVSRLPINLVLMTVRPLESRVIFTRTCSSWEFGLKKKAKEKHLIKSLLMRRQKGIFGVRRREEGESAEWAEA